MTMKTICTFAICAAFAHSLAGVSAQAKPKDPKAVMKAAERIFNEKFGGRLTKPGTGTGCTGFINVGSAVDRAEIDRYDCGLDLDHAIKEANCPSKFVRQHGLLRIQDDQLALGALRLSDATTRDPEAALVNLGG